jgi:hypothetical protein
VSQAVASIIDLGFLKHGFHAFGEGSSSFEDGFPANAVRGNTP